MAQVAQLFLDGSKDGWNYYVLLFVLSVVYFLALPLQVWIANDWT